MATYKIKENKENSELDGYPYYEVTVKNLNPKDMRDAAEIALQKWGTILDFLYTSRDEFEPTSKLYVENGAADTCGLCELYFNDDCNGCPVQEITGRSGCHNTPYYEFENAHNYRQYRKAVEKEVAFLRHVRDYVIARDEAMKISVKCKN